MDPMNRPMSPLLASLLRLSPEPYQYHDDEAVHVGLTRQPSAYMNWLMDALRQIASGRASLELPPKTVFADPGERSDFRVMPCVVRFPDRVRKTVKIVGTNWPRRIVPGEISVGKAFALNASENFIEAGFAACLLSSARTGACAAAALDLLARRRDTVAIVGAGRVGYYAALYAQALGGISRILFADRNAERAGTAASLIATVDSSLETGTFTLDDASVRPDILILATDSEAPVFDACQWHPDLVISVGADTHWQREIAAGILDHYDVFVDTPDSCLHGDLARFMNAGRLDRSEVTDLQTVLTSPAVRAERPAVFVSTGSALFDNLTIDYLLEAGFHPGTL